jgi:hypothetical protein
MAKTEAITPARVHRPHSWRCELGGRKRGKRNSHRRAGRVFGLHSMTSSAVCCSRKGISTPIAFAVLRFTTSSYLVGC